LYIYPANDKGERNGPSWHFSDLDNEEFKWMRQMGTESTIL
jgi:hypothetical protein